MLLRLLEVDEKGAGPLHRSAAAAKFRSFAPGSAGWRAGKLFS